MDRPTKIEISSKTVVFTVFFLLFIKLIWMVKELFFSLFIAFIIMSAIKPLVVNLVRLRVPRMLATFLIFICLFFLSGLLIFWIFPPIIIDTGLFLRNWPAMVESLNPVFGNNLNLASLSQYLPNITNQIINIAKNIFSNAIFILSTIFFSIYFVIEENFIKRFLIRFFDEKKARYVADTFEKVEKRMNSWFWGELTLMVVVGTMTFIGLTLIGVRYALPLAIIAGFLEAIPNLGPTVSAIPAFFTAITQSYFLGFSTIALYFIIQQLENNLIVPFVMKKAVGLNPIITLISLIVGGKVGGILGILLAIPFTLFLETILIETIKYRNK